ncbi:hypothetical protein [Acidovorax sp.]|uniref:hypothetical protein n=1 Tax=Acidovorax sp. TaxID=1872122 RepID=UPI004038255F
MEMLSNEDGSLIWSISVSSQLESDWIALHRILWLNSISGKDLFDLLRKFEGKRASQSELLFRDVLETSPLLGEYAAHFRSRGNVFLFGKSNQELLLKWTTFKYCPVCLDSCFHSPIFCLVQTYACPVHHCQLVTECLQCGKAIGSNHFALDFFNEPLACYHCKHPFTRKNIASKVMEGLSVGLLNFREIEGWISRVKEWTCRDFDFSLGKLGIPTIQKKLSALECLNKLTNPPVSIAAVSERSENLVEVRNNRNLILGNFEVQNHLGRSVPLNDDIKAVCAVAKSIGRHLGKQIRKFCKHNYRRRSGWENADRPFRRVMPVLIIEPGDCPCCALMDQWRAYSGKVLSLRQAMESAGCLLYDNKRGENRGTYCLEANLFAQSLISSFTWFAMEQIWFLSKPRPANQYYQLDVYRFEICFRGFMFDSEQGKRFFRYSLASVLLELEKCHEKMSHFEINSYPSERWSTRIERDIWYIDMSSYFFPRRNFDWWQFPVREFACVIPGSE